MRRTVWPDAASSMCYIATMRRLARLMGTRSLCSGSGPLRETYSWSLVLFCIEKHKDACGIPYFDRYAANGRTRRTHPVLLIRPTRGEYYEHRRAHSTPIDSLNAWVQELRVAYSIRPLSGECVFVTMHARQMLLHPFGPHRPHEEVECVPTVSDR